MLGRLGVSEVEPNGDHVLQLAIERDISAYNDHFVAVDGDLDIRLVTADKRLLERCKDGAISIEDFTATSS